MTRLLSSTLRHFESLRTHALGYLSDLRVLELRGTTAIAESQEDERSTWSTLHRECIENLLQVVFQYFRTLYSLEDLQASTTQHLVQSDHATELLALLDALDQELVDEPTQDEADPTTTIAVAAVEQLAASLLVDYCYEDPELYLDPIGYYRFVPELSRTYWSPVFTTSPQEFFDLVTTKFHQDPRRSRADIAEVWSEL